MREYIDAAAFKEMILCAYAALRANSQAINELNVFPVPDGDTGTNMCLTMSNAATMLQGSDYDTVDAVSNAVASALLRGARGNSGVILSLLFRGIAKRLKGLETAGAAEFTGAMNDGVEAAYKAVMKPAEGTILTVSRLASAAAEKAAKDDRNLEDSLLSAIEAGEAALADTVNQNPVLKKAGVIDAGGKGYMTILTAMVRSLRGEIRSADMDTSETAEENEGWGEGEVDVPTENVFDTVYIVRKKSPDVDLMPLRRYLDSIGDSLVISDDDEIFKVHVHTDIPGEALTESQKYGTLELAKIENMRSQAEAILAGRKAQSTDDLEAVEQELEAMENAPDAADEADDDAVAAAEKHFGVVTVCAGEGMANLFRELGADGIVTGGQTMNPSTDDILKVINHTPAETVFVLPNNKNITMAAEQCIPLTEKKVIVMPTRTVPQGVSALLNLDPDADEAQVVSDMRDAISRVHTAMVTYAARDSEFDGHSIKAGEYLALLDGALLNSYPGMDALIDALGAAFEELDPEFITIYYGSDVKADEAEHAGGLLSTHFPEAELSIVDGGQPVYYYMISVE